MPFSNVYAYCRWTVFFLLIGLPVCGAAQAAPPGDPPPTRASAADQAESLPSKHLPLTIDQAILLAFENNPALRIERMNPRIQQTHEDQARSAFDPVINGQASYYQTKGPAGLAGPTYEADTDSGRIGLDLGVTNQLPTGTTIGVDLAVEQGWSDRYNDYASTRAGLSIVQALLKGRPVDVNLAALRRAEWQTRISLYELRGFAETLLAEVEQKYWQYTLAWHQVRIFEESLSLAETQLRQTGEMIRVGRLAETELVAGRAEMALRRQELIGAAAVMETSRLQLLRLINPPGADLWNREIELLSAPIEPDIQMERLENHIAVAMRKRADLNQAQSLIEIGEIDIIRTRNGLLPQLDLFISLGKTGYADSFAGSVADIKGDGYEALAGISFSRPVFNRNAKAQYQRAQLSREQAQEALANLRLLIELDVRTAYIQTDRTRQQIAASQATRLLQEEKLRIETEKFRVGRSTNFLVAQAQRDLVRSQSAEIQAVADYLISLTRLHLLEGSLLERRGIEMPE